MINTCLVSWYLAYGMAIYCFASAYYLIRSRNVGTPFKDSLNDKQKKIKQESSKIRRDIFLQGLLVGLIIVLLLRPFSTC
jgi:hypothetical protein